MVEENEQEEEGENIMLLTKRQTDTVQNENRESPSWYFASATPFGAEGLGYILILPSRKPLSTSKIFHYLTMWKQNRANKAKILKLQNKLWEVHI